MPTPAGFEREALIHLDAVYRFARSLTQDDSAAEDLAQDTFLQALQSWQQYQVGSNCRAWLFTICRHRGIRQGVRAAREEATDDAALESLASAAVHSGLATSDPGGRFLDAPELPDVIRRELALLPVEFREVVVLADLEDQSYESIASVLGVPKGTVKSRLFRGRRLLQERLVVFARDEGLLAQTGDHR
jgi:RNA polymerase sigma-70 factor (ECF subfamily)